MALGNITRKQGECDGTQTNIDLECQRGLDILVGRRSLFVLLLLVVQVSGQNFDPPVINCTSNDTNSSLPIKILYDEVGKALWDSSILPMTNSSPLNIRLGITISAILGVNEKEQMLTIFIWQTLEWALPFLRWNASECGTNRIAYPKEKLWIPDVVITEFMDEDKSPNLPYLYINSTGNVYLNEPKRAVLSCSLDIFTFPFDYQNCTLTFTSFLLEDTDMTLYSKSEGFIQNTSVSLIKESNSWDFIDVKQNVSFFNITKRRFCRIQYFVAIKRNPGLIVANLLIPSLFLFILDVVSFLLPPDNSERSAFKMTLILGYTIFLLIMNDLLPPASKSTPLLSPTENREPVLMPLIKEQAVDM